MEQLLWHARVRTLSVGHFLMGTGVGVCDETVRVWRLSDGKFIRTLTGHAHCVTGLL